jgi:hypothetical protein
MTADIHVRTRTPQPRPVSVFRRAPWEAAATAVIAAGVVMLMQPFSITLYGWSFATTLAGIVLFTIGSKLPE